MSDFFSSCLPDGFGITGHDLPEMPDLYYFRVKSWANHDNDYIAFMFQRHYIMTQTPKGVRVCAWFESTNSDAPTKLVLHKAAKKFAHPTKAGAWRSFLRRQQTRIRLTSQAYARAQAVQTKALSSEVETKLKGIFNAS